MAICIRCKNGPTTLTLSLHAACTDSAPRYHHHVFTLYYTFLYNPYFAHYIGPCLIILLSLFWLLRPFEKLDLNRSRCLEQSVQLGCAIVFLHFEVVRLQKRNDIHLHRQQRKLIPNLHLLAKPRGTSRLYLHNCAFQIRTP